MFVTGWWNSSRAWFSRSNRNYCGYLVAAWLCEIIINLLLIPGFFDVAWVLLGSAGAPSSNRQMNRAAQTENRCAKFHGSGRWPILTDPETGANFGPCTNRRAKLEEGSKARRQGGVEVVASAGTPEGLT
jgi:hypothetical protein